MILNRVYNYFLVTLIEQVILFYRYSPRIEQIFFSNLFVKFVALDIFKNNIMKRFSKKIIYKFLNNSIEYYKLSVAIID